MRLPPSAAPQRPEKNLLTGWLMLLLDAGACHGYGLQAKMEACRLSPDPAALYRTLRKLEEDGSVVSECTSRAICQGRSEEAAGARACARAATGDGCNRHWSRPHFPAPVTQRRNPAGESAEAGPYMPGTSTEVKVGGEFLSGGNRPETRSRPAAGGMQAAMPRRSSVNSAQETTMRSRR